MVVMPQWTDQTTNAKLVQDIWKVGVRVKVDENGLVGREVKKMERREIATSTRTHVLVLPFPAQGHINPMVHFSKRLASKGLKVTLVATNKSMQPQDTSIQIEHISDCFEEGGQKTDSLDAMFDHFRIAVSRGLPELIEKQKSLGCPVTLVVYDSVVPWVLDTAHQLGLYGAAFFTQSCAVCTIYYHEHQGSLQINPSEGSSVSMPSMPSLRTKDLPSFIYDVSSYPSILRLVVNQFSNYKEADWRLFNTFDKLEAEKMERQEVVTSSKTHVLLFPFTAQGHINPMVQFSKRLASKGLKVTLVATNKSMQSQDSSIKVEHIANLLDEGDQIINSVDSFLDRLQVAVSHGLPELIEKQKGLGCPVKIVVYDSTMPWVLDILHKLGLYGAVFHTQSSAIAFFLGAKIFHGSLKIGSLEGENVVLPSMPLMGVKDLPSFISDMDAYPALLRLVVNWMASQWPIKTIGPTIPSMYLDKRLEDDKDYGLSLFKPGDEDCIKWLDTKESGSVVYVSFGSLANLGEDEMEELACGLKQSNRYFLWVVRASEVSKLPTNFATEASEKGLVVNWCPQLKVLAHPAMGCFMTHCGWNSTLEALSLGVPMLAVPQWTDQPTNAKYVVDIWEAGVRVKVDEKGKIRREEIEMCIREVMEGERGNKLKRNAVRWKEVAQEAVDKGGSSDKHIDEFISELACR
ncbi:hypothetical protein RJ640_012479 [Escallonia rubra]|uniref:Glycosyltransferase N-terminal domain-containing protein n=1 Tax=Escallonia rubra TaxID=112253 RepID=A0AA88UJJ6_9ASTE|nr:hypothetical protein RJ640_012479 [Escallonia rubra]